LVSENAMLDELFLYRDCDLIIALKPNVVSGQSAKK
jgi:hypothetical protein